MESRYPSLLCQSPRPGLNKMSMVRGKTEGEENLPQFHQSSDDSISARPTGPITPAGHTQGCQKNTSKGAKYKKHIAKLNTKYIHHSQVNKYLCML